MWRGLLFLVTYREWYEGARKYHKKLPEAREDNIKGGARVASVEDMRHVHSSE